MVEGAQETQEIPEADSPDGKHLSTNAEHYTAAVYADFEALPSSTK